MSVNQLYKIFIASFLLLNVNTTHSSLFSQRYNLGTPLIQSFSPEEYLAGTQNWDIEIAPNGLMYFANNDGLLVFDGERWQLHAQSNNTIARSIEIFDDNIYVGGQDELGYFKADDKGMLKYYSLLRSGDNNYKNLEDIWQIIRIDSSLYIQNRKSILLLKHGAFNILAEGREIEFLTQIGNALFFNNGEGGFFMIQDQKVNEVNGADYFSKMKIVDVLEGTDGRLLVFTESNGIFIQTETGFEIWQTNAQSFLKKNQITSVCKVNPNTIALGTRLGGVVVIADTGLCQYVIDKKSGLQNNSINDLKPDNWGNLWVASYYGIDRIDFSNHTNYFVPDGELEGAVFDIELWEDYWWFGTANGLYYLPHKEYYNPFEPLDFRLVPDSEGQVWGLDIISNQLYMAHHKGAFEISKNGSASKLGGFIGAWKFIQDDQNHMIVGAYDGLYRLTKSGQDWKQESHVGEFEESSRIMIVDKESDIWISHPYRGVFKLEKSDDVSGYSVVKLDSSSGFETDRNNYVFNIYGTPYLTNDKGIYRYSFTTGRFLQDSLLVSKIGYDERVRRLIQEDNYIWYIADGKTGYIKEIDSGLTSRLLHQPIPALKKVYVGGFENLFPIDSSNIFVCSNKGVLYKYQRPDLDNRRFTIHLAEMSLPQHELSISGLFSNETSEAVLEPYQNNISFKFRTNGRISSDVEGYSYLLSGVDDKWTEVRPSASKEYNNLSHGDYTLRVKALDKNGWISEEYELHFKIHPPWYLTPFSKSIYALFMVALFAAMLLIPRSKYRRNTDKLKDKQRQTMEQMQAIKKEKLETEIAFKNKELAVSTMHLLQKNKTLNNLRSEVEKLRKTVQSPEVKTKLKDVINLLQADLRLEDDWEKFSFHFDQVHQGFIKKLKQRYPDLTPNDHQLCAYLKMNLSTKEIAPLLNISVRGVEISRYRLRKKLNLERDVNLNEFMNSF